MYVPYIFIFQKKKKKKIANACGSLNLCSYLDLDHKNYRLDQLQAFL